MVAFLGRPSDDVVHAGRVIERAIKQSRAVDTEALCIVPGEKVWSLRVDIRILDDEGNVVDCACLAAMASLHHFRRPEVSISGEDVVIVRVFSFSFPFPFPFSFPFPFLFLSFLFFSFFLFHFFFCFSHFRRTGKPSVDDGRATNPRRLGTGNIRPSALHQHTLQDRQPVPLSIHHTPIAVSFSFFNSDR